MSLSQYTRKKTEFWKQIGGKMKKMFVIFELYGLRLHINSKKFFFEVTVYCLCFQIQDKTCFTPGDWSLVRGK